MMYHMSNNKNQNDCDHSNFWVIMIIGRTPNCDLENLVIKDRPRMQLTVKSVKCEVGHQLACYLITCMHLSQVSVTKVLLIDVIDCLYYNLLLVLVIFVSSYLY